jgi:hypothetical protein
VINYQVNKACLPEFLNDYGTKATKSSKKPDYLTKSTENTASTSQCMHDEPQESIMSKCISMQSLSSEDDKIIKYSKFYMAMILNEILKETPLKQLE